MMHDLLVSLYNLNFAENEKISAIEVRRLLSPNADALVNFVEKHFSKGWASEIKAAIYTPQPKCFIALDGQKMIGFACYDATAKAYFGPIGVDETYRGKNIGTKLLYKTLEAMYHDGYGYAIIGGVNEKVASFYAK